MSFALALKEPPDDGAEEGVAAGAAALGPTAGANGAIDGATDGAIDGAAGVLEGDGNGVEVGDGAEAELGDSEPVPGVAADTDGAGLDGAAEAEAPLDVAAASQAVTHPW